MIRIITAVDNKNGIARNGRQPWDLPEDLKYVRQITQTNGANVLMGHKTYRLIGHALDNRHNYVLTHAHSGDMKDAVVVTDLSQFLADFRQDIWVFGGAQVYEQTIGQADELYITKIEHDYRCDQFFPDIDPAFKLVSRQQAKPYEGISYSYNIYKRR